MLPDSPKIVHVTDSLGGDTLAFLAQATRLLVAAGVRQTVLYSRRDSADAEPFDDRVRLIELPASRGVLGHARSIRSELLRRLVEPEVAAVHLHASRAGLVGRLALLGTRRRAPLFFSPHGMAMVGRRAWLPGVCHAGLERLASRQDCTLVAGSRGEAARLTRLGGRPARLLEGAVDDVFFSVARREAKPPLVLSIGRIDSRKDPERFAELAARFHIAEVPARFVWVGGGDAVGEACLRASGVEVTGPVDAPELAQWLEQASVYVRSAHGAGASQAVLQALAAGVPCIVDDAVGSSRDAVRQGITGYAVKRTDEMVMTVQRLLHDETLRRRFSLAARRDAQERFSSASFQQRLLQLYGLRAVAAPVPARLEQRSSNIASLRTHRTGTQARLA